MAELTLPENFFFGAAMSGPQTEGGWNVGGKLENVWDTWSNEDIGGVPQPRGLLRGQRLHAPVPGGPRHPQGARARQLPHVDPVEPPARRGRQRQPRGRGLVPRALPRGARGRGSEPFVTLYHFDLPTYLFRRGGWESRETCEAYANYVEKALREFGKEVRYWFTFNEPSVEPENRYWHGGWYPQHHSFREAVVAQYNISVAHALGVARYRAARGEGALRPDARIGIVCNFSPSLHQGGPERGRPRGAAHERRPHHALVARPRDQGRPARGRARDPRPPRDARPGAPRRRGGPALGRRGLARLQLLPALPRAGAEPRPRRVGQPALRRALRLARARHEREPRLGDLPQGHLRLRHEVPRRVPRPRVVRVRERHRHRGRVQEPRRERPDPGRLPRRLRARPPRLDRPRDRRRRQVQGLPLLGPHRQLVLGRTPSRTATASSRSTSWRTTTAGPRGPRRGSGRLSRRTW